MNQCIRLVLALKRSQKKTTISDLNDSGKNMLNAVSNILQVNEYKV